MGLIGIDYMIDIKKDRLKKFFIFVVAICILFFISKLMLKGAGLSGSERNAFLVVVLIVFLSASKKSIFGCWFFPMCFYLRHIFTYWKCFLVNRHINMWLLFSPQIF
ncbi:hypothetical protein AYY16_19450 [Morganella psychrotolerans]|nr:hypothetical protein AYY16_19450 [Morganella psychrotolerans]